jgi:Thioredoxin-like domain
MITMVARRQLLATSGLGLVAPGLFAQQTLIIPLTSALDRAQSEAAAGGNPLVVMVSLVGCPFCKVVREHYLLPMMREQQLPVVQVDMQSTAAIRDFGGNPTTHMQLIKQWGVRVAPTVLFFGKNGVELAERLRGSYLSDFYGSYLETRVAQSRKALS